MTRSSRSGSRLRDYYALHLEIGLALALLLVVTASQINVTPGHTEFSVDLKTQEVVDMEEIKQTEQDMKAPPPPKAPVPVEVPNDVVVEQEDVDFDASLDLSASLDTAGGPPGMPKEVTSEKKNPEDEIFVVVEEQPKLIGGMKALQEQVDYPEFAQKAGIEGRVFVEFVVNKNGRVENPRVTRGVHKLLDDAAVEAVKKMRFKPGMQRNKPVKVRMTLPVKFELMKGQGPPSH